MGSTVAKFVSGKPRGLLWLGFCLLLPELRLWPAQPTAAGPQTERQDQETLTASVYDKAGTPRQLLYRFKRVATRSGDTIRVLREFSYPDGKPAAREQVLYDANTLKTYQLEELQTGWTGTANIERAPNNPAAAKIVFTYRRNAAAQSTAATRKEPLVPDTLVSDMLGFFFASHWEALQQGRKVTCRYVVVPRRETIGFSFKTESESKFKDRQAIVVKMQPSSLVFSVLVDPLYFTVEKAPPHRVLQYTGRTMPKKLEGGQWQDLDAVTVFDWPDLK